MAEYIVIGLSTFGEVLARKLYSLNETVVVIDRNQDKIKATKDYVTQAIVADATDKTILKTLVQGNNTTVIVSLGKKLEESVMVTYYLQELGVKNIIAKTNTIDQEKVLQLLGANKTVHPERDTAIRLAEQMSNPNLLESFPLSNDFSIIEFAVPHKFIGKSLAQLKLRHEYQINVLAIKVLSTHNPIVIPPPDYIFTDSDIIVALGNKEKIRPLTQE